MENNTENYNDGTASEKADSVARNKRNILHIIMLSVLAVLLIATIILVAFLGLPASDTERPILDITDNNGSWEAQGAVAVFGESVCPGSSGKYEFALRNPHAFEMNYSFSITPRYNGEAYEYFPLRFRLRMNNVLMETEEWLGADELAFSEMYIMAATTQSFTLEWQWPFEAGTDENDTLLGKYGGGVSMILNLRAQSR